VKATPAMGIDPYRRSCRCRTPQQVEVVEPEEGHLYTSTAPAGRMRRRGINLASGFLGRTYPPLGLVAPNSSPARLGTVDTGILLIGAAL
jgi:hypothetical protein